MKFHKVEVDSEVFQYVQAHAEPLVDTFNSALRRLLLVSGPKSDKPKHKDVDPPQSNGLLPNLSGQTPRGLRHTLEVAYLVRGGGYDRPGATQFVAKLHNVLPQTVHEKCCRQLNLKAREFDRLLEQPDLKDLKGILTSKFPDYEQIIDETLN